MKNRKEMQATRAPRGVAALIWSLVVAALLITPGDDLPQIGALSGLDKLVHALLFAIHFVLLARALAGSLPGPRGLGVAAMGSVLYAALLEILQRWVPGRSWELWDLGAGIFGIALAALFVAGGRARLRPPP